MKSQKILAFLLALVMVLGLATMATAAAPNDKVQINNMMVDASLVETMVEETVEPQAVSLEAAVATTAYNPGDNAAYAPINAIAVDWPGYEVTVQGIMQGRVIYGLTMPGASTSDLLSRTLTFTISNRSAMTATDTATITLGTQSCSAGKNSSSSMVVDLSTGSQLFTVAWTEGGTSRTATCMLNVSTPAAASVELTSLTVAGTAAAYDSTTVGGVTRYNYTATLPSGTVTTTLDAATVVVVPTNTSATMTLKNADGTEAATGSATNGTYTFSNVNFNAGTKTLTVTCGSLTRDYQVSASVDGQKVTVYFALRTYLAEQWLNGSTTYYDYESNGFGSGDDLSDAKWDEADGARSGIAAWNAPNAPESIDATTNRPIFAQNSYVAIEMDADAKVMDVLTTFISRHSGLTQTGASNNYVSEIAYNGNALGEFTCGQGSGWMYTARSSRTDVTTALPNAGAASWAISNGMYIDWYYTAAYGMDFGYSMFDM